MEISMFIDADPSEEELLFARQLGIGQVFTATGEKNITLDFLNRLKEKTDKSGLKLIRVMSGYLGKCHEIHLALPERDRRIDEFVHFLEMLNKVEVPLTTFTWEPDAVWSSDPVTTRESVTRFVDLAHLKKHSNTHGRDYSRDEIWENYHYFMERIMPVAESSGVKMLLHPNDPPTDELGGVPCLIRSRSDYERAFELGNNTSLGMEFCCGCWLEGGDRFGNVLEDLEYFVGEGRVGEVHFRNVSSTLPVFTETFLDEGYMDMSKIIRLLDRVNYSGTLTLDHTPVFTEWAGGKRAATAYAIGYIRALRQCTRADGNLSSSN